MKSFIKQLTPPIIISALKSFRKDANDSTHTYETYDDALKDCIIQDGYQEEIVPKVIARKTEIFINELNKSSTIELDEINTHLAVGLSKVAGNERIYVLDFGGACGVHYFNYKKFNPRQAVSWHVVETDQMCKYAKQFEDDELKFFSNIESAVGSMPQIDFVLSSGAVQYVPNPIEALTSIFNLKAQYVLLTRLSLNEGKHSVISKQKSTLAGNGIGPLPEEFTDMSLEYPHTNIPECKIDEIFSGLYEEIVRFKSSLGAHFVPGFSIKGTGVLYQLK